MALISCPDCHQDVSDKAPVCVKCGYPIANSLKEDGFQDIPTENYSKSAHQSDLLYESFAVLRTSKLNWAEYSLSAIRLSPSQNEVIGEGIIGESKLVNNISLADYALETFLLNSGWQRCGNSNTLMKKSKEKPPDFGYDYCTLYDENIGEKKVNIFKKVTLHQYSAKKITANGLSPFLNSDTFIIEQGLKSMYAAEQKIKNLLLAEGWEPHYSLDDIYFKKIVSEVEEGIVIDDHAAALRKLAQLKDDGLITEEDFEKKKAEILRNI